MHLKQCDFTDSAFGYSQKTKKRTGKFMQTGNTDFIYKNELDKACFQMNFINRSLKKLKNTTFIHHLKTIFGAFI